MYVVIARLVRAIQKIKALDTPDKPGYDRDSGVSELM